MIRNKKRSVCAGVCGAECTLFPVNHFSAAPAFTTAPPSIFWVPQVYFALHVFSLSFHFLPLFLHSWHLDGQRLLILDCLARKHQPASEQSHNSFGPSVSAQPHLPPGVSDQDAAIYWQSINNVNHLLTSINNATAVSSHVIVSKKQVYFS